MRYNSLAGHFYRLRLKQYGHGYGWYIYRLGALARTGQLPN